MEVQGYKQNPGKCKGAGEAGHKKSDGSLYSCSCRTENVPLSLLSAESQIRNMSLTLTTFCLLMMAIYGMTCYRQGSALSTSCVLTHLNLKMYALCRKK